MGEIALEYNILFIDFEIPKSREIIDLDAQRIIRRQAFECLWCGESNSIYCGCLVSKYGLNNKSQNTDTITGMKKFCFTCSIN